jgi:hypothetical protein
MNGPPPILSIAIQFLLLSVLAVLACLYAGRGLIGRRGALLGAVFGVTPEAALALSLLRRARDLAIGIPALLAWQTVEAMRSTSR